MTTCSLLGTEQPVTPFIYCPPMPTPQRESPLRASWALIILDMQIGSHDTFVSRAFYFNILKSKQCIVPCNLLRALLGELLGIR